MLQSVVRCYSFIRIQPHSHKPRNREPWDTNFEECDATGADLPRDISYDIKFGLEVAVQYYTELSTWLIVKFPSQA